MGQSTSKRPDHHVHPHSYGDDNEIGFIPGDIYDKYQVFVPSHKDRSGEITTLKTNQSSDLRGDMDHLVGMPSAHQSMLNPRLLATAEFRNKTGLEPHIPARNAGGGW